MSDLSSLMSIAPNSAAFMMGDNQSQQMAMEKLRQQELSQLMQQRQQTATQDAAMNPLRLQQQQLQNQGLQEGLGGITADSLLKQQSAQRGAATMGSDIGAANSKNQSLIDEDKFKLMDRLGKQFTSLGPLLESVPADAGTAGQMAPRHAAAMSYLQSMGMPLDSPQAQMFKQILASTPASDLPRKLKETGDKMIEQSAKYKEEMDKQNSVNATHIKTTEMNNKTSRDVEGMRIEAGKYDKKNSNKEFTATYEGLIAAAKGDPIRTHQINVQASIAAQQAGDPAQALMYADRARAAEPSAQKAMEQKTNPNAINPGELTKLPTNGSAQITPPGMAGSNTPFSPLLGDNTGGMVEQAKAAWGSFEPNKYEYRMGPNGKLQRKAK